MLGVQEKQRRGDVCGHEIVIVEDVREKVGHLTEQGMRHSVKWFFVAIGVGLKDQESLI